MTQYAFQSAVTLAAKIQAHEVSCVELLEYFIERTTTYNPQINAIVVTDFDRARLRAREADEALSRNQCWGPLHGLPMTVKESFSVNGLPTTFGIEAFRNNIATTDAVAIQRLKDSGANIFGKTNVPPRLADAQSANPVYGRTNNPWNLDRTPGGSSGGSAAALAAGLVALELGSDIASSIRNPSHYCGVFGHKPTFGICPTQGHSLSGNLASVDISVIGPIARSAEDLALVLGLIAGPVPPHDAGYTLNLPKSSKRNLRDFRVGILPNDKYAEVDTEIESALSDLAGFLVKEGAKVAWDVRPALDSREVAMLYGLLMRAAASANVAEPEFELAVQERTLLDPDADDIRSLTVAGVTMSHREWLKLHEKRLSCQKRWLEFFRDYDVLLCPVMATTAFPHSDKTPAQRSLSVNGRDIRFGTQLFWAGYSGVSYLPSTVAPVSLSPDKLPIGIQIVGSMYNDLTCIHFAHLLEQHYRSFVPPPMFAL